jgi:hypothetical protein
MLYPMAAKNFIKPGIILFSVSLIIILVCYFLPLTTSCEFTDGPEEFISTNEIGALQTTYYLAIIFLAFIFILSFIKNKAGFISVLIISVFGGIIILFFNWIGQAGWGKPCGHQPTIYQNLLYLGHVLFVLACCMKSYKNMSSLNKNQQFEDSEDLLDRI